VPKEAIQLNRVSDVSDEESSSESSDSDMDIQALFRGKNNDARISFRPKGALSPRCYAKFKVRTITTNFLISKLTHN